MRQQELEPSAKSPVQVDVKTIVADWAKKEVIKMIGGEEFRAPMKPGPEGKIVGVFGGEMETVDYGNFLLAAQAMKKPAAAKAKAKAKGGKKSKKGKGSKKAKVVKEESEDEECV